MWGIHPWLGDVHPNARRLVDAVLESGDIIHWWGVGAGTFLTASDQVGTRSERRPARSREFEEQVVTYATPAGELTEVHYVSLEGKPGYCKKHLLETEDDVEKLLSVPYVPPRPDCSGFAGIDRQLGDRGLPMVSMPADPMYFVNNLTGSETFAFWSIDKRALLSDLIATFAARVRDWVQWVLSQGVGPLFGYVGPELCIPPLQSPRDFEQWVVGPDGEIIGMIHAAGGMALVHCHGRMGPVLEGFVRMGVDALHPIEPPPMGDVTLAQAKRRVGADLCIVGNIQHHDVCTMPHRRFRAMVEETVRVGMAGGRFILCPTATPFGWPTMSDLELANWLAILEVGREFGAY
jgi:Uroporphyrinogen decarboxylase (URO-D)